MNPDGARLRSLFADFLVECYARSGLQLAKFAAEQAIGVEIDFATVGGFDVTEFSARIQRGDRARWLKHVGLWSAFKARYLVS